MGLFAPWFLAGLIAAGLPLWLHLLRQYRENPQRFSSLMFFERRLQSSTKRRRLQYPMLLALRLALLALLVLAFANPFVRRMERETARRKLTVIAVDRSFSMRYGDNMQRAKAEARRIIGQLNGSDIAEVIALDSRVEALTRPETDRNILISAIDSIQAGDLASSFGELTRALRVIGENAGMRLDVYFISDMQESSMPADFADLRLGANTFLKLHCIGDSGAPNWAVETVSAPTHIYGAGQARVSATIAGWNTPMASRRVSLLLNGKIIASKEVSIPANGRAGIEFLSFEAPYGANRGEIRIEPHDPLPNDDEVPFSIERADPRKVLFLYQGSRSREAFYYKAAMESSTEAGLTIESMFAENAAGADLSKYSFVVLGDDGELDQVLERKLREYVRRGGGLLISIGPSVERAGRVPVTGDRVAGRLDQQSPGFLDGQHPALAGVGRLENVQFFVAGRLSSTPDARVIARFADASPLVLEQRIGEGRVLTFDSTLDNSTSDFCLHPSFLPFVVQTGRFLAGSDDASLNVTTGTPVQLRRGADQATAAEVIGPDGKHELSLAQATKSRDFNLDREGFYEVQRADGKRLLMAVHSDRRESDLRRASDETLALWRNTGSTGQPAQSGQAKQETRPWNLWRYFLFLALLVALVESVFASRYLREGQKAA
ncbi:MAG: BatA domain-containing protein [Acidobacteriaceae bacterium]|nr:BatA domain-containing protein [Acidobacteriaceae bacterium]MBV9781345.1 BatA domain-containing protein [Acidobacteriaceae bacterium]